MCLCWFCLFYNLYETLVACAQTTQKRHFLIVCPVLRVFLLVFCRLRFGTFAHKTPGALLEITSDFVLWSCVFALPKIVHTALFSADECSTNFENFVCCILRTDCIFSINSFQYQYNSFRKTLIILDQVQHFQLHLMKSKMFLIRKSHKSFKETAWELFFSLSCTALKKLQT